MNKYKVFSILLVASIFTAGCASNNEPMVGNAPSLVKEGFVSNNEYEIICRGFPKEGLTGIQKEESARRAALLNVYFYAKSKFDDTVSPDRDGKVEKFTMNEDHGVIYYVITKSNLKKRVKKQ